ncbi:MAG: hypothetical protein CVV30_08435 [Methanomicrobiales archaeon HGW-Methanomicrobiales-1]|jgi:hypothetical protein|nr:MAG: hypothetical protein CVV30_08435 [Methanomicrobiales archaeon HGW-Methanomicrobiales-1]
MKHSVLVILALLIAGVMVAGCTQSPAAPAATPVPTSVATPVVTATDAKPSFTMGDHYLQESYSFQSENDVIVKQFRVDNPAWGIEFDVLPLNDNTIYCWFEMKVTNMDTGHTETYGYGRNNGFDLKNQIPMYTTGPYKLEMKGNRVKVDVTAAKRNP